MWYANGGHELDKMGDVVASKNGMNPPNVGLLVTLNVLL